MLRAPNFRAKNPSTNGVAPRLSSSAPFIDTADLDFVLLADRALSRPDRDRSIAHMATVCKGYLDGDGVPCIGGQPHHTLATVDFALGPLFRAQSGLLCRNFRGQIIAPSDGQLRVARVGDFIDLCIGELPRSRHAGFSGPDIPAIAFRFFTHTIVGSSDNSSDMPVTLSVDIPTELSDGQVFTFGNVAAGDVVGKVSSPTDYYRAMRDASGNPITANPPSQTLSATRLDWFSILNKMQRQQNDLVLATDGPAVHSDPADWMPAAMYVFSESQLSDMVESSEFMVTPALREEFCRALSSEDYPRLVAAKSGTISAIAFPNDRPHLQLIKLSNGHVQLAPACAILTCDVGDSVSEGEVIGSLCPPTNYNWDLALQVFDQALPEVVGQYLVTKAIRPGELGWQGPGVLLPWQYAYPMVGATAGSETAPAWRWDLRPVLKYLDSVTGVIGPPPSRRLDMSVDDITVNGTRVFLGAAVRSRNDSVAKSATNSESAMVK